MDSAMRPREIQSRIRAGQSLDEVARLSGEPAERIERFAAPVLAEREHVAHLALTSSVRRRGDLGGHRVLNTVIGEQLTGHGIDPDDVGWDAWRQEDKRWAVQARWRQGPEEKTALFHFDLVSRFSVADDAEARWLIGEGEDSADADELALVRVVGNDAPAPPSSASEQGEIDPDLEPTISLTGRFDMVGADDDWFPTSAATPQEIREELEAEIDAYGVVPEGRSELDVLYDMLGGIAEDSINIYAGLADPVLPDPEPALEPAPPTPPAEPVAEAPAPVPPQPVAAPAPEPPAPDTEPPAQDDTSELRSADKPPTSPPSESPAPEGDAATADSPPAGEQPALVDNEPTVQVAPGAAKRRGARKKRASVPSWDEIMFGGPKPD